MVYRRTYCRRIGRRRRRTAWYNRKYSTAQIARAAWRSAKYIRGLVNSEMLHKDNTMTLGANQSQIFSFVNIAQGDDIGSRTGNSILLRNMYIRGRLTVNNNVTNYSRVMIALVKDKQQVADTTPAITDIFTSATDPDTLLLTNALGRFKIMWRKTYILTTASGGMCGHDIHKYWTVRDHVRYNGTSSTDIQRNGYYLVVISDEAVNYPVVSFNARTSYHDN